MSETIHLTVQSQLPVGLTTEQARVIRAVSPTATVERITGGAEVTVTDYEQTTTAVIYDGAKGDPGEPGQPGAPGQPGQDGVSPTASVTQTETGATVTVTDASGTTTATLTNGQDGAPGQPGQDGADGVGVPAGGTAGQVLTKVDGTDYNTEWTTPYTGSVTETVSGTTPTITAQADHRYICGEVSTLDITTPATGIIDVVFTSGSTATVLTVTPPTGLSMKWANGFDPTILEANTVYEINIMDGVYGVVGQWT